jgi:tryptophan synthase alpha chain
MNNMSRISELFQRKPANILSIYSTAGYPHPEATVDILEALEQSGADMIELGMPYSDPLADGPVIQEAGSVAIANGMTIAKLFSTLENFRNRVSVPIVLMGYMNPVLQYGFEKFCAEAARVGVDGLILPDLPVYEFEKEYSAILNRHGLDFVFMVTPETSPERIRKLDELSSGFLYAVSSSSTTGQKATLDERADYFRQLKEMQLKNPVLIGFGIRDKAGFEKACAYANGAIIGTAFIQSFEKEKDSLATTRAFVRSVTGEGK